jgi:uncharacterized protein YutE (UPF0331/DUF86 family)
VNALKSLQTLALEQFTSDHILQGSAERDFQVAIQAALDIASIILAEHSGEAPSAYADLFPGLSKLGVIPEELSERLVNMARFRNVLVHIYLEVDPKLVYQYIQNNLNDFDLYTQYIARYQKR